MGNSHHKKNKKINDNLANFLPGSLHYNFRFPWEKDPIHFLGGSGHFLTDIDGNTYLDFFSKFGALIVGHKNKMYTRSLSKNLVNKLSAVDHIGEYESIIIKKILSSVPGGEQVRFSLSGTEAVQNALRLARSFTWKNKVIRFNGHYHGNADNILGGFSREKEWYIPRENQNDPRGTAGRSTHAFLDSILLPWNNIEILKKAITHYKNDIAAIIMEPICINGGGIIASNEYYKELKKISKDNGIIIIFDEIITGFRLQYGTAQSLVGIKPDIWIFGKAIGGGSFPISCIISKHKIMDFYSRKLTTHGGTFNGYPLGLYAIGITLDLLQRDQNIYQKISKRADLLKKIILNTALKCNIPIIIQGHPMAMCIHATNSTLKDIDQWSDEMKEKEEIIRVAFLNQKIILAPPCRIYPNITLNDKVITFVQKRIDSVFMDVKKEYEKRKFRT